MSSQAAKAPIELRRALLLVGDFGRECCDAMELEVVVAITGQDLRRSGVLVVVGTIGVSWACSLDTVASLLAVVGSKSGT